MLLKSSHHWKVISNTKVNPSRVWYKEKHKGRGKERRTQGEVGEEEKEE